MADQYGPDVVLRAMEAETSPALLSAIRAVVGDAASDAVASAFSGGDQTAAAAWISRSIDQLVRFNEDSFRASLDALFHDPDSALTMLRGAQASVPGSAVRLARSALSAGGRTRHWHDLAFSALHQQTSEDMGGPDSQVDDGWLTAAGRTGEDDEEWAKAMVAYASVFGALEPFVTALERANENATLDLDEIKGWSGRTALGVPGGVGLGVVASPPGMLWLVALVAISLYVALLLVRDPEERASSENEEV